MAENKDVAGDGYRSPEEKAMGVYSSENLPPTELTGVYAPQITEDQRLKSNFQSASDLSTQAAAINAPSPLQSSADLASTPFNIQNITKPSTIYSPLVDAATVQKGAPLGSEYANVMQQNVSQIPEDLKGTAASVAVPQAPGTVPSEIPAQPPIDTQSIMNPFGNSDALAMKGISDAQKAGVEKAVVEHSFFQKKADVEQEALDKQQKLQEAFDFKYQEKMDDYTQSIKDFKALAGDKVIPGAILARQDTTGSIMTGLAVALGGIGGALQGTNTNVGLEMINKAIDRDVAAQQFNMDYKYKIAKTNIDDQSSMLSKMKEKFGDDKSAILATKLGMLSMVEDQMNSQLTKQGGAVETAVGAQAATAKAVIMKQKEMYSLQLKAAQAQQFEQSQMTQNLKGSRKNWSDLEIQAYEKLTGDKTVRDRLVPGWGTASNKNLAEEFSKANNELQSGLDGISRIKSLTNGFNKVTDLATRRKLEVERQALVGNLRLPFTGPGILNEGERKMLESLIGDPSKIMSLSKLEAASLAQVETKIRADQAKRAKMAGLEAPSNVDSLVIPNK
jgi:hypothetical protein